MDFRLTCLWYLPRKRQRILSGPLGQGIVSVSFSKCQLIKSRSTISVMSLMSDATRSDSMFISARSLSLCSSENVDGSGSKCLAITSSSYRSKPRGRAIFCRVRVEVKRPPVSILPKCDTDTPDFLESWLNERGMLFLCSLIIFPIFCLPLIRSSPSLSDVSLILTQLVIAHNGVYGVSENGT